MRRIIDTHSFIWFIEGDLRLTVQARRAIEDPNGENYLSVSSLWEMAIKTSLGKLHLTQPFEAFIPEQLALNGIELLPLAMDHVCLLTNLPFHHRDPFDRLIIVQSIAEGMPVVSKDSQFDSYGIERVW